MDIDIKSVISELAGLVDGAMGEYCRRFLPGPGKLTESMRYSLEAGGKRVRPALVLLSCELYGGSTEQAMIPAVAIEMIHTFSLIHDDLPAMDNDDFRRGRPTNHKVYGEAMAILAGDALLAFAFELIAKYYDGPADRAVAIIRELAEATGPGGMTGGQVLDMTFGENGKGLDQVEQIHMLKTAALIRGACRMGAISAGATEESIKSISEYGLKLGLAFQVIDDYLDQTASGSELGKKAGKDAAGNKPNYAIHAGDPQKAWDRACQLVQEAKSAIGGFGDVNRKLLGLADLVLNRKT